MMEVASEKQNLTMTPEFRVAFAKVFVPEKDDNGVEKYSLVAIFPKGTDLSALKAIVKAKAEEGFGPDRTKWPTDLKFPFRDGKERADKYEGFEEGSIFVTLSSKYQPRVVNENVQPIINPKDFYSGCWARATVNAFHYGTDPKRTKGKKGVSLGVNDIQKTRDDKPFAGRPDVATVFTPVAGAAAPAPAADDDFMS